MEIMWKKVVSVAAAFFAALLLAVTPSFGALAVSGGDGRSTASSGQGGVAEAAEPGQEGQEKEEDASGNPIQEEEGYVPGEIIVVYDDADASAGQSERIQEEIEENLEEKAILVEDTISEADGTQGTAVTAEIPDGMSVTEAIAEAQEEENVAYAQPNYVYTLMDSEDAVFLTPDSEEENKDGSGGVETGGSMDALYTANDAAVRSGAAYYLDNANVSAAWDVKKSNGAQIIAVLDTGCRYDHEDLQNNILLDVAYDAVKEKLLTKTTAARADPDGHGTHVCGLAAAQADNGVGIAGSSYNARILPVNVFDSDGESSTAYLQTAFQYIKNLIDNKKVTNLHVINLSLGSYADDQCLHSEIRTLKNQYNILCVCAGGNEGISAPCYPADYDECLSVAWHGVDQGTDRFTIYTDLNAYKDVSAPGYDIYSTYNSSSTSYVSESGSSMAAPIVSGVCALVWSYQPGLGASQVYQAVTSGSRSKVTYRGYSLPKLDALGALLYVGGQVSLSGASVSVGDAVYTGKKVYPAISAVYGSRTLVNGEDYVVTYYNNKNVGTGSLRIDGIGSYTGSLSASFSILPKGTSISSFAKAKKGIKVKWKKQKKGTTGYQIQYARTSDFKSAKTVTVKKNTATSKVLSKLKKKKTYYIRIRTYKKSGKKKYYSAWSGIYSVRLK